MWKQALKFDTMITPKIITLIYWLICLGTVIGGLGMMFSGYQGVTFEKFLMGLFTIVAGIIGARIWCELLIVLFKIHENLKLVAARSNHTE